MPRGSSPRSHLVQSVTAPSRPVLVDSQIASGCIQDASEDLQLKSRASGKLQGTNTSDFVKLATWLLGRFSSSQRGRTLHLDQTVQCVCLTCAGKNITKV